MTRDRIHSTADQIFGPDDSAEKERWIEYWQEGKNRYQYYLEQLERMVQVDFSKARVLDIGCGAGGLDALLAGRCRQYVGIDYKAHILKFTSPPENAGYTQGNGISLPLPDASFDFVFAFDVLEHLTGGITWQEKLMNEISRVLRPLGMVMISTPNFWYPYDAHSRTLFPHFLPAPLADRYIEMKNPEFIKEHESFRNIKLLRPGKLNRIIRKAGLKSLHSLPCCLDRDEYLKLHPLRGLLALAGLGWLPHVEFWMILTRAGDQGQARRKLKKNFRFRTEAEKSDSGKGFHPEIDFSRGNFYCQLGRGWHWPEQPEDRFRWIEKKSECFLEASGASTRLEIKGYSPIETRLSVSCDNLILGIHQAPSDDVFELQYPLLEKVEDRHLYRIQINSTEQVSKDSSIDPRELSVQLFSVGIR